MTRYAQIHNSQIANIIEMPDGEPAPDGCTELPAGSPAGPGWSWVDDVATPPAANPQLKWIDVGPFYDRFGTAKMTLLMSTNPVAVALRNDSLVRKYIDLGSPALSAGLTALAAQGIAGVDNALRTSILTTPTTEAERHIKGLA